MLVFGVDRKKIYLTISILVCLCAAFALKCGISGRQRSIGAFLSNSDTGGRMSETVEIFDIKAGKIVGSRRNNAVFRREACKYLGSVTGMYGNVKVFPDAGYIVRIPVEPPAEASPKLLKDAGILSVDTVYVIFPEKVQPYLLILDGRSRPLCFNFDADTAFLQDIV